MKLLTLVSDTRGDITIETPYINASVNAQQIYLPVPFVTTSNVFLCFIILSSLFIQITIEISKWIYFFLLFIFFDNCDSLNYVHLYMIKSKKK